MLSKVDTGRLHKACAPERQSSWGAKAVCLHTADMAAVVRPRDPGPHDGVDETKELKENFQGTFLQVTVY